MKPPKNLLSYLKGQVYVIDTGKQTVSSQWLLLFLNALALQRCTVSTWLPIELPWVASLPISLPPGKTLP